MLEPLPSSIDTVRELILPHTVWKQTCEQIRRDPQLLACGTLRRHESPSRTEWLLEHIQILDRIPADWNRGTEDVCLLRAASATTIPAEVLQRLSPQVAKTLLRVSIDPHDPDVWSGEVCDPAATYPLDGMRVIGPGMPHFQRDRTPTAHDIGGDDRWTHTAKALGARLWKQVRRAHIAILGCNRCGTLVAWQLAGMGVHELTLVDPKRLTDADREILSGLIESDVGQPIASALAKHLVEFNPELLVRCRLEPPAQVLERLRSRFDLLITCAEAESVSCLVARFARHRLLPHLDLQTRIEHNTEASVQVCGDIRLSLPGEGCCQCIELPPPPKLSDEKKSQPTTNEHHVGAVTHLTTMTVGTALELWLSLLNGNLGSFHQRLVWTPNAGLQAQGAVVQAGADCRICRNE